MDVEVTKIPLALGLSLPRIAHGSGMTRAQAAFALGINSIWVSTVF